MTGTSLPGFGPPAVGFDTPFDMLMVCHERVLRTLALQERLCAHSQTTGCDGSACSAARDILRYFDLAAPLHHEYEELHVFPALEASAKYPLRAAVAQLQNAHDAMTEGWVGVRVAFLALAKGGTRNSLTTSVLRLTHFPSAIRSTSKWRKSGRTKRRRPQWTSRRWKP